MIYITTALFLVLCWILSVYIDPSILINGPFNQTIANKKTLGSVQILLTLSLFIVFFLFLIIKIGIIGSLNIRRGYYLVKKINGIAVESPEAFYQELFNSLHDRTPSYLKASAYALGLVYIDKFTGYIEIKKLFVTEILQNLNKVSLNTLSYGIGLDKAELIKLIGKFSSNTSNFKEMQERTSYDDQIIRSFLIILISFESLINTHSRGRFF